MSQLSVELLDTTDSKTPILCRLPWLASLDPFWAVQLKKQNIYQDHDVRSYSCEPQIFLLSYR